MRPIGFSTGALARADFRRGLLLARDGGCRVVELSALREEEFMPLLAALDELDLDGMEYVSIHLPGRYDADGEAALVERLLPEARRGWPFILHPDAIRDAGAWRALGALASIENMDKRKAAGRTARELGVLFTQLPDASFCFDIGHAHQVDPTMTEARTLLREFGARLTQVHVSEVNARSRHDRLSMGSMHAFREVAHLIPARVPLILETPVARDRMEDEVRKVMATFAVEGAGRTGTPR